MLETVTEFLANTPYWHPAMIAVLIGVGTLVGFINTIAGMATALSYGLFMWMGLPINVANGTSRLGLLAQFTVNSVIFKKEGYLDLGLGIKIVIPTAIGSLLGAELAAILDTRITQITMGVLLPVMAILLFVDKKRLFAKAKDSAAMQKMSLWKILVFLLIGVYSGFTHAGAGLLIIFGSFFLLGLDLVRANAIKQFTVAVYTPIALVIFAMHGQVNWGIAGIYAIGNIIGGIIGSKTSIKWGAHYIRICVTIVIFVMSAVLLYKSIF